MLVFLSFLTIAVFPSLAKYPSAFRVPDDGRAQITRKVLGLKLPDLQLVLSGGMWPLSCYVKHKARANSEKTNEF